MDAHVKELDLGGGLVLYQVWIDGRVYDTMTLMTGPRLTWAQQAEVAENYRKALE